MKSRTLLWIGILIITTLLIRACGKKSTSACTTCEAKPDVSIPVTVESELGGIIFNAEVFYSGITSYECEIGIANGIDKDKFAKMASSVFSHLNVQDASGEKTIAFTVYRNGELHMDESVLLKDMAGIGRYYTKNGKLYHQLFVKAADNQFSLLPSLSCQVDGAVFNYMHIIGKVVLGMDPKSTALFVKNETAFGVYSTLKQPYNDLRWKLEVYMQKRLVQLARTSKGMRTAEAQMINQSAELFKTCGEPCTKNDNKVCRNGDRQAPPGDGAACGPAVNPHTDDCRLSTIHEVVSADRDIDSTNIKLDDGTSATLHDCVDLDNFTLFRDSALYLSATGEKYIDYYYMIGNRLGEAIDLATALKTLDLSFRVNKLITILMSGSSDPHAVLITASLRKELIDILAMYKGLITDPDGVAALNDIMNDMYSIEGKTVAEVRALLGM